MSIKMARTRERSLSPAQQTQKRLKTTHIPSSDAHLVDACQIPVPLTPPDPTPPAAAFVDGLLAPQNVQRLHTGYVKSEPWKHCVLDSLVQDDLLESVKDECLSQLSFTQKETDIYKVNQTGDLASLSYLPPAELALLPSLLKLRDALYSPAFLSFLQGVTGCGPLSLSKRDMSVNSYTRGCHLLNHDDVIGTRRVSYILYMPRPRHWRPEWGGALELYPPIPVPSTSAHRFAASRRSPSAHRSNGNGGSRSGSGSGSGSGYGGEYGYGYGYGNGAGNWNGADADADAETAYEPAPAPSVTIPPAWGQFVFFEVQPGRSFHAVEEVVVGAGKAGRARLSVSGWFHAAQAGEPGYEGAAAPVHASPNPNPSAGPSPATAMYKPRSTREQLVTPAGPAQFTAYADSATPPHTLLSTPLPAAHFSFLSEFLNPVYLQPRTLQALAERFAAESSLELHTFLKDGLARRLEGGLRRCDEADGLGLGRGSDELGGDGKDGRDGRDGKRRVPAHSQGTNGGWAVKGPPHKARYCVLRAHAYGPHEEDPAASHAQYTNASSKAEADELMRSLQDELFPSNAFRAWLALVSQLLPLKYSVEARRFRRGLDYTLAGAGGEAKLDVVLGLTPNMRVEDAAVAGRGKAVAKGERGRANGIGGHVVNGNGRSNGNGHASGSGVNASGNLQSKHASRRRSKPHGWSTGEWGGWECYMAAPDEDDDPAVYRASSKNARRSKSRRGSTSSPQQQSSPPPHKNGLTSSKTAATNGHASASDEDLPGSSNSRSNSHNSHSHSGSSSNSGEEAEDEEDDGGTLLTVQPGYNRLLLVLRDEGVLRFVKYVSAAAESSRWDVCGEYEVGMVADDSRSGTRGSGSGSD